MARLLADWYSSNKRQLPWRTETDTFLILVSEILLRKTQARAVNDIYHSFFTAFPDVQSLDRASHKDIQDSLIKLGLSAQRASQLKVLSRTLILHHEGAVPKSHVELLALPGIGPYAASMVAAILGDEKLPGVDSNVSRVIVRLFGVEPIHLEARKSPNIWALAGSLLSGWPDSPSDFNWAVLDLAHSLCTPRMPKCCECPLMKHCSFAKANRS